MDNLVLAGTFKVNGVQNYDKIFDFHVLQEKIKVGKYIENYVKNIEAFNIQEQLLKTIEKLHESHETVAILSIWIERIIHVYGIENAKNMFYKVRPKKFKSPYADECAPINLQKLQQEIKDKDILIQKLNSKYVKHQLREQIQEKNVIYIITTKLMKAEQRYILGKATDLTSRLSTYNKTDEHEIIYYQQCSDMETMGLVEKIVFQKLKPYREQANRERFILPGSKDISLFIDTLFNKV